MTVFRVEDQAVHGQPQGGVAQRRRLGGGGLAASTIRQSRWPEDRAAARAAGGAGC